MQIKGKTQFPEHTEWEIKNFNLIAFKYEKKYYNDVLIVQIVKKSFIEPLFIRCKLRKYFCRNNKKFREQSRTNWNNKSKQLTEMNHPKHFVLFQPELIIYLFDEMMMTRPHFSETSYLSTWHCNLKQVLHFMTWEALKSHESFLLKIPMRQKMEPLLLGRGTWHY